MHIFPVPGWRNGRRSRLKICFPQGVRVRSPSRVPPFFLRKKKGGQRKTGCRFFEKSLAKTPAVIFYRRGVFLWVVFFLGLPPLAPAFWGGDCITASLYAKFYTSLPRQGHFTRRHCRRLHIFTDKHKFGNFTPPHPLPLLLVLLQR